MLFVLSSSIQRRGAIGEKLFRFTQIWSDLVRWRMIGPDLRVPGVPWKEYAVRRRAANVGGTGAWVRRDSRVDGTVT